MVGAIPNWHRFGPLDARNVAVPVLAPWRVIYWALAMRGSCCSVEANARDFGPLQALCKESRDRLIKSKSGTTRAPHCATTPQCCYGIAGWPRGHPQQNPRPTGPKKQSRPTPPKGTLSKIATPQVPVNARHRLPQARPRGPAHVREPLPIRCRPGRARQRAGQGRGQALPWRGGQVSGEGD